MAPFWTKVFDFNIGMPSIMSEEFGFVTGLKESSTPFVISDGLFVTVGTGIACADNRTTASVEKRSWSFIFNLLVGKEKREC